jgi:2-methylcitrate dehydratase PrpD
VFKPFPCCAAAYPAISAVLSVRHEVDPETIESIAVTTTRSVGEALAAPRASNSAEARLSLEYCLAAALARGRVNLTTFSPEALEDRLVRALMGKMSVSIDDAWHPAAKFGVVVAIRSRDGQVRCRRECSDGEVDDRLSSEGALREKFLDCASPILGDKAADAYDHLMAVGEAGDIWDVIDAVIPRDAVPG